MKLREILRRSLSEVYSEPNSHLLNYMRSEREADPYQAWEEFVEWVFDDEDRASAVATALGIENMSADDLQEEEPDVYLNLPDEIRSEFDAYYVDRIEPDLMQRNPTDLDTRAHMSLQNPKLLKRQTWLVHFSDSAREIAQNGFTKGIDDVTRLGLTTYLNKRGPGYNFAFEAPENNVDDKYGSNAVMFQNSGIEAYHGGDEEYQIVFWGPDVNPKNIILLEQKDGDWFVMPHPSKSRKYQGIPSQEGGVFSTLGPSYHTKGNRPRMTMVDAQKWVMQNWRQYGKVITGW